MGSHSTSHSGTDAQTGQVQSLLAHQAQAHATVCVDLERVKLVEKTGKLHDSVSILCSLWANPETERWRKGNIGAFSGMGAVSPLSSGKLSEVP